jgi:hypothetical protein
MRLIRFAVLLIPTMALACGPTDTTAPDVGPVFVVGNGASAMANGGGHYLLAGVLPIQFSLSSVVHADGRVTGRFHHSTVDEGELIEFHGDVTCLPVDPVNHRAWIGGVITDNNSTHPAFQGGIFEPGHDVWFRMVDYGEGAGSPPDRITFVGFEGSAGIATSEEYCALRIWPDGDARTWPITGNLSIRP